MCLVAEAKLEVLEAIIASNNNAGKNNAGNNMRANAAAVAAGPEARSLHSFIGSRGKSGPISFGGSSSLSVAKPPVKVLL